MPRKEKEADNNHIGPRGPCGRGACGSWPNNGPRRGSPCARPFLQRRACALWKSNDVVRYYFSRLGLCTKHLGKSCLCNGAVLGVPVHGDAVHRRQ